MSVKLSRNYQMSSVKSRKRAHTHLAVCAYLVGENINKLSAVPWGTWERVRGNSYERLGRDGLYCCIRVGPGASRLVEPRTPHILCGGVSDKRHQPAER